MLGFCIPINTRTVELIRMISVWRIVDDIFQTPGKLQKPRATDSVASRRHQPRVIFNVQPEQSPPKSCFRHGRESSLDGIRPGVKLAPFV